MRGLPRIEWLKASGADAEDEWCQGRALVMSWLGWVLVIEIMRRVER